MNVLIEYNQGAIQRPAYINRNGIDNQSPDHAAHLQEKLNQQEKLMSGVLKAMNQLLISPNHKEAITGALSLLGESLETDLIIIFENEPSTFPEDTVTNIRYEWHPQDSTSALLPPLQQISFGEQGLMRWYNQLAHNSPITGLVKDLPLPEKYLLTSLEILSLLLIPIFIRGNFWGFVGFFDCDKERVWSENEIAILMTASNGFGGAIHRKRTEQQLRQALEDNNLLTTAILNTDTGVIITDPNLPDNPIIFANQGFSKITGYSREEVLYHNPRLLQGPATDRHTLKRINEAVKKKESIVTELCNYRKDGTLFWNEIRISPVLDTMGNLQYFVGLQSDVTRRKQDTEQLKLYAKVVENTLQGVIITDRHANIIWGNVAFTTTTGYSLEEVVGENPRIFQSGLHSTDFYKNMWLSLKQTGQWQGEVWNRRKNGDAYVEWLNISSIVDEVGEVTNYVAIFSDITDRKRFEQELQAANEKLKRLSSVDGLTNIANRRYFEEFFQREWALAIRNNAPLSIIMIDVDHFKIYNDTYGHQEGDECLKIVASTLSKTIKRPTDLVARYGGEEFVVVLPQTDSDGALVVAEQLREHVARLMIEHINSKSCSFVSISLGIATVIPDATMHREDLLHRADQGLYMAKRQGGNRVRFV